MSRPQFTTLLLVLGFATALLPCVAPAAAASDRVAACLDQASTAAQRQCAERLYRAAVLDLNKAYDLAVKRGSAADVGKSQDNWKAYRDAECRDVVGRGGGSGRMVWVWGCLAEKTLERVQELNVPFDQR